MPRHVKRATVSTFLAETPTFPANRSSKRLERSVGIMNTGITDPELRKKKLNAECPGERFTSGGGAVLSLAGAIGRE